MAEDFVGAAGRLEEQFVHADNAMLKEVAFEPLTVRAAKEKPQLLDGLGRLKKAMGEKEYGRLIDSLLNMNLGGNALLLLTGDEQKRTALTSRWLPALRAAFDVEQVRVVGGGRNGVDAY